MTEAKLCVIDNNKSVIYHSCNKRRTIDLYNYYLHIEQNYQIAVKRTVISRRSVSSFIPNFQSTNHTQKQVIYPTPNMNSNPDPTPTSTSLKSAESTGAIDGYNELPPDPPSSFLNHHQGVIFGVVAGLVVLLILVLYIWWKCRVGKKRRAAERSKQNDRREYELQPQGGFQRQMSVANR